MSRAGGHLQHAVRPGTERILLLNENRFAYTAIERLSGAECRLMPRLVYLSGPAGCGKSLLARRFVQLEQAAQPAVAAARLTASEFAAEFAEAADEKCIPHFQEKYRALDVLVLEDLRSLCDRPETLLQFRFVLDDVLARGGRVLLTSRSLPGEMATMPPRLVNRFHAGVCAVMQPLCQASRVSLLQHFAQTRQIPLTYESTELLARELPVSPRELLATLTQLDHFARHNGSKLDARTVSGYLAAEIKPNPPTLAEITRATARHFRTTAANLRGHSRKQSLILPRQCAMSLARSLTGLSLSKVADHFGGRHHSSIAYACEQIKRAQQEQPGVRQHLTQIRHLLRGDP